MTFLCRKEKEEYQKNFEDLHKLQDNASSSKVVSDLGTSSVDFQILI